MGKKEAEDNDTKPQPVKSAPKKLNLVEDSQVGMFEEDLQKAILGKTLGPEEEDDGEEDEEDEESEDEDGENG